MSTLFTGRLKPNESSSQQDAARRPIVFLSHSHLDYQAADLIKTELEAQWGFVLFVAHRDISPSRQWRDEIDKALRACDIFVALLTTNWLASDWTDQEAGIAVALRKVILPISIDGTMPYGFLETYQAMKWNPSRIRDSMRALVRAILERVAVEVGLLMRAFEKSPTYDDAAFRIRLLLPIDLPSADRVNRIARATLSNLQNRESGSAQEDIRTFLTRHWGIIDKELRNDLAEVFKLTLPHPSRELQERRHRRHILFRKKPLIDDLFLIRRDGRLIMHTTRRLQADRDTDILAGMLTAIMMFVQDTFGKGNGGEGGNLRKFSFGEKEVAIELSEHAYCAAIFTGEIPEGAWLHLRQFLADIEDRYGEKLDRWSGDIDDLRGLSAMMEDLGRRGKWQVGDWK